MSTSVEGDKGGSAFREEPRGTPARRRLVARVGEELAGLLLFALAADQRGRARRRGWRRGSSSP